MAFVFIGVFSGICLFVCVWTCRSVRSWVCLSTR